MRDVRLIYGTQRKPIGRITIWLVLMAMCCLLVYMVGRRPWITSTFCLWRAQSECLNYQAAYGEVAVRITFSDINGAQIVNVSPPPSCWTRFWNLYKAKWIRPIDADDLSDNPIFLHARVPTGESGKLVAIGIAGRTRTQLLFDCAVIDLVPWRGDVKALLSRGTAVVELPASYSGTIDCVSGAADSVDPSKFSLDLKCGGQSSRIVGRLKREWSAESGLSTNMVSLIMNDGGTVNDAGSRK